MLPKSLMNSRRLMGFTPLAENHLRESLIRSSSESYAPRRIPADVRFVPKAEVNQLHSMTLSARVSNVAGKSMPSDLAVCRLMTNSNLVDCATGKSAGLVPLRTLPA
jgi:hypothetical protein